MRIDLSSMRQTRRRLVGVVILAVLATLGVTRTALAAGDPCVSGNAAACENSKPGDSSDVWDLGPGQGAGDASVQGFTTAQSVTPGSTVQFKIKSTQAFTIDIFRLGYYGGLGARRQAATIAVPITANQPVCLSDASTQNFDCGNWSVTSQWGVPSGAVSGIYIAHLKQADGSESLITFIVRDDTSHSDVLFKTSDATWQAYNAYGGSNFYTAPTALTGAQARAFKISYNRPIATRGLASGRDFVFSNEYPTLRFLERNGIDVTYTTDIDVSINSAPLTNHRVVMSVGHDEYWTGPERTNVENARDAGVNLMFLSGNEVYWHTRLEPSIDGTSTANRTLVCYKDSWEPAPIDPVSPTPTFRDPRTPAPNGNNPENSLTGTLYMSNNTDLAITVSAAEGRSRLWRGTTLASLPAGGSAQLAPHTVGYESDEDLDNGYRPAGLMHLSTTTGSTEQKVQDPAGTQVAPGTTTHNLTLYRAASGALVFGAGTIQWGWGLDQYHDGDNSNAADPRMQQATLNMLADMSVAPTTLMTGLTMPVKSTDTTAPTVTISAPTGGASLANGSVATVSGTATDVGGVVTNVEVSLDGGLSYHRATGTTSWSISGVISGAGMSAIKVRASDDSANLSSPTTVGVTVSCPCSLFGDRVPTTPTTTDSSAVELGVKFVPSTDGFVSAIRFYKGIGNVGTHLGTLWSSTGVALGSGTFTSETASGWQTLVLPTAVPVTAGVTYVASYYAPVGRYAADASFFARPFVATPLTAPTGNNGVFADGHHFPSGSFRDSNYWVDVLFNKDDTTPPAVSSKSPLPNSTSVVTTAPVTATFAATVDPTSVQFTVVDSSGATVASASSFNATTRTATLTPLAPFVHGATYTASIQARSGTGVSMAAPATWSFTTSLTDPLPGSCPCSVFSDSDVPTVVNGGDSSNVELGMKFTADVDGQIAGVRFYKGPMNLGVHVGSVWSLAGAQLATVTFSSESSTGWQTAYFDSPVNVTAGTTYIVSYRTPVGGYSLTANGLAAGIDVPPLHTPAHGGVYTYGTGAPLNSSDSNYYVDVVFKATDAAPTVVASSPGSAANNVSPTTAVSATMSGPTQSGTVKLDLKDAGGTPVSGTTSFSTSTRTVSFLPSVSLLDGTAYTATVSGGVALSGNLMSPTSWTFVTAGVGACPCTLFSSDAAPTTPDSGDSGPLTLGVRFTPSVTGFITSVRFFKSAANTGTHTAGLWSSTGARLATATFSGESASGWQTATFAQPIAVQPGQTYVATYYAPNGHYAVQQHAYDTAATSGPLTAPAIANGLYRYGTEAFPGDSYAASSYWVTPLFQPGTAPDTTPPTVASQLPTAGAVRVGVGANVSAVLSEDVAPGATLTVSSTSTGAAIAGATTYDSPSRTLTFTPTVPLSASSSYTAAVQATDLSGNTMSSPTTWSFTTAGPQICPCSVFGSAETPQQVDVPDPSGPLSLGMAFSATTDGFVTGVRFYKGANNTGAHTGSLWTAAGQLLAAGTFSAETDSGWQTLTLATPMAVTADTPYVVAYSNPAANWSATPQMLNGPLDATPLIVAAQGGRYVYGTGTQFPSGTSATNYWVDVVFSTTGAGPPVDTTSPVVTAVGASPAGTAATVTWTTDEPSSSVVTYGTTLSLGSTATGAVGTSHTVALSGLAGGTTYYYRVTSVDAAGNSTTAPAVATAPATFQTSDVTPPVVTGVSSAVTGRAATITWTTDESATSVVSYGSTAALGTTVAGTSGTAHSVTLSALPDGATYFYRVTSTDAAGNATTSPAVSAAPATFVVPDQTAPVVTAVAASGSGTTASVTWTTNESATSVVQYGTSATALTSTAAGPAGTSHAVTLSGLTASTRYYYRVTSADAAANSTTSPATTAAAASYAPTVTPFSQTTAADFATGTLTGAYVAQTGDGEVQQAPTTGVEFDGTALPSGWTSTVLATGGTTRLASGKATISGTRVYSTGTTSSPKSVEVAAAALTSSMRVGFGNTGGTVYAAFGVNSAGQLVALAHAGFFSNSTTVVTGINPALPHRYRVDWTSSTRVSFVVDGVAVLSNVNFTQFASLNAILQDTTNNATPLVVDWLRVSPFDTSDTYVSKVFDAGATVGWDTFAFTGTLPAGTTRTIQVRSGNVATPNATWTGWTTVATSGASITRSSRYLQYQILMTSTGSRFASSTTDSVQMGFHVL